MTDPDRDSELAAAPLASGMNVSFDSGGDPADPGFLTGVGMVWDNRPVDPADPATAFDWCVGTVDPAWDGRRDADGDLWVPAANIRPAGGSGNPAIQG